MDGAPIWTNGPAPQRVAVLGQSLDQVTNAYKHLWLLALVDMVGTGRDEDTVDVLAIGMIRRAWAPVLLFRLSFGLQDQIAPLVREIAAETGIPANAGPLDLSRLDAMEGDARLSRITRYVPTRFLAPWLPTGRSAPTDAQVPSASRESWGVGAGCPYRLDGPVATRRVRMDPMWMEWVRRNSGVIRDFARHRLCTFLQGRNPSVPGIVMKLDPPAHRNLEPARRIWSRHRERLASRSTPLLDIYTGRPLEAALSMDHYLPWSFVAHDQLWNLVPTTVPVNSSKSDDLPHDRFLDRLARSHHDLIGDLRAEPRLLGDHAGFLGCSMAEIGSIDADALAAMYRRRLAPLAAIAELQGFRRDWEPSA